MAGLGLRNQCLWPGDGVWGQAQAWGSGDISGDGVAGSRGHEVTWSHLPRGDRSCRWPRSIATRS